MSKQVFIDKANNIKLIATDIDGVWTDARMHYTENGEYMKSFSTYDGMATGLVKERNIEIAILTSENSKIVTARAKKLGIKFVYINEKEKLLRIKYLCNRLNINLNQVAYIGDDINDLREILLADYRRGKRNLSITFEYRFGDFQKKKYRRQEQREYNQGGGMDAGF